MHPIFFTWKGTYDELMATRLHEHRSGAMRSVAVKHDSAYVVALHAASAAVRKHASNLHDNLVMLPGPHGKLDAKQAKALQEILPAMQIKEGDSIEAALSYVHSLYGDSEFDPNAY